MSELTHTQLLRSIQKDRKEILTAAMRGLGAKSPYDLIETVRDTFNLAKRQEVTDEDRAYIRERTLANPPDTAAQIAEKLGLSAPTIHSQRRKLGLIRAYAPKAPKVDAEIAADALKPAALVAAAREAEALNEPIEVKAPAQIP